MTTKRLLLIITAFLLLIIFPSQVIAAPQNLARQAKVWASSSFSDSYSPRFAVDGQIPEMLSRDDAGKAWATDAAKALGRATFTLQWLEPVPVAEIIYYGRTAFLMEECFRQYQVFFDDNTQPVASGVFEMNAGPQRIKVPVSRISQIRIEFLDAYSQSNAGAAEIEVYSQSPLESDLPVLKRWPRNLAMQAQISATSVNSAGYLPQFACDGKIPDPFSANDAGLAWCVDGGTAQGKADFTFAWEQPVTVSAVAYYGRSAWLIEECFKNYEVWLDDDLAPVATGQFKMGHGPQVVNFASRTIKKLTLRFLNSYGGPNAGASEIQVFDAPPPEGFLAKFLPDGWEQPEESEILAQEIKSGIPGISKLLLIERRELNPSHVYTAASEGFAGGGGLYVLSPVTPDGKLTKLLDSPNGMIMDCDVSFDGTQIIFSWKQNGADGYHIYKINSDGTGLTQLTDGPWHDYNACFLPDGDICFVSTRACVFALCFVTPSGVLYRMKPDGSAPQKISGNYINDFTPAMLHDGRILYSRWEYVDKPAIPIQSLWTLNPDGTGLSVFYGNRVLSPATFVEAKAVPDSDEIICTMTAHNGPIRGAVGLIRRAEGVNAQAAIRNLTPGINIGEVDKGDGNHIKGPWENPWPLGHDRFLVSGQGNIYFGDFSGNFTRFLSRTGTLGYFNPMPLQARIKPSVVASTYNAKATDPEATVILLDVYDGLLPHVKRGEIRQLAVIEEIAKPLKTAVLGFGFQRPVISCGATYAPKKIWGYVPIEEDGSAHFKVPTGKPIYFEALDAQGQAVQRMRSFTHFIPGETRGCVGCHEPRESASKVKRSMANYKAAVELAPPDWGVRNFDYSELVQPVLDEHCASCHSGINPPRRIDLSGGKTDWFNVSYDVLTRGWVNWIDTRNGQEQNILQITPKAWGTPASRLTSLLLSGHLDMQGNPRIKLSKMELRRLLTWIDLNVPYYDTYEMAYPDNEGGRRILPAMLEATLEDVRQRRCASCHPTRLPSEGFVRITEPELNDFLLAPLTKSAGGRESCGAVFADKNDSDYQLLLNLFEPVKTMLANRPRVDMPGGEPQLADRNLR